MDDKQMIYNGVDISGCNHYKNNGKCRIPHYQQGIKYTCCNCNEWDCYYKQLKAKEQECETLASLLDFEVQKKECLEQECEELKQTFAEIKEIAENAYCLTNHTNKDMAQFAKTILQKISGVLNGTNS